MSSFKKDDEKTHTTHKDMQQQQHNMDLKPMVCRLTHSAAAVAVDEIFPYKCQSEIIEPFSAKPHSLLGSLPCILKKRR